MTDQMFRSSQAQELQTFSMSKGHQKLSNEHTVNQSVKSLLDQNFKMSKTDLTALSATGGLGQQHIHLHTKIEKRTPMDILARDTSHDNRKPVWTSSRAIINQKGC